MDSLEARLTAARALDAGELADAIESIGFECTRCGACCRGDPGGTGEDAEDHVATVFPEEVRTLQAATGEGEAAADWRDVARPVPFGLAEEPEGRTGTTFEWALQTDECGDCTFYREGDDTAPAGCSVYGDRPLICRTYPFSLALGGTSQPMGEAIEQDGLVRAHECEGLGRDIDRADAEAMARTLKTRAVRELEEAIGVRDRYEPVDPAPGDVVVHDSEGPKRPDGRPYRPER